MFTRKKKIACILLVLVCIATLFLVSCKKDPVNPDNPGNVTPTVDYGIDNVYFMVDGENEYLFTISGNTFMISGINGDQAGTFTYANGALTLAFKEGDTTNASAVIENGVLKLTYNGSAYRLLPRSRFTVSFDVDGGSEVAAQKVLNGRYAVKPDDPVKAGYAFIGWYADKAYTTAFAFDSAIITADTTLYARFEAQPEGSREYTGILIAEGTAYNPVKTVNGILYNLPTPAAKDGNEFAGWWVSDYQSALKPTYQYTGQKLTQDVTLFAVYKSADTPLVSISATGAAWNALGANISYRVTVKSGDNVITESNTGSTEYKFDFSSYAAGDYSVTVTANGKSGTAYYRNKALDRVSNIRVVSSNVLVFDPVPGAEKYTIRFNCGNPAHDHSAINNGKSTHYVFANCEMPKDGIVFAVSASAEGYLDSIATYTFYQKLGTVEGVTVDNAKVTWYPVDNATMYLLRLSTNGLDYEKIYVTDGTSYSIAHFGTGAIYASVQPIGSGYYSEESTPVRFVKTTLAMPAGISVSGKTLTWNAVEGATGYNVSINGTVYQADGTSLELTADILTENMNVYNVAVQACAEDSNADSPYSATVALNYAVMGGITYENGCVYWEPVLGATKYLVRVGVAPAFEVDGNATSAPVTFTDTGVTTVSVCFVDANGDVSAESATKVEVFLIELDVRGGNAEDAKMLYKAFGDDLNLPKKLTRIGYDFAGWYNTPNGLVNGKEFTLDKFEGDADMVLYAAWSAQRFTITLDPGSLAEVDQTTITVIYGNNFTLPVPRITSGDTANLFSAWRSEANGAGIPYTDERGESLFRWNVSSDVTLYAAFEENALKFTSIDNDTAYSVSQGAYGIGRLTEITIPATYDGKPVTTIEAAGFVSCSTLVTINIPNTITNIEVGTKGINATGSAFQSCYKLENINIYDAGAVNPLYFSVDGVLYYKNPFTSETEIKAYPYARAGVLRVAVGTTTIPAGVFNNAHATEIYVPYTVTKVGAGAFTGYYTTKIVFTQAPDGVAELPLSLANGAIKSCTVLTSVTLPGRMREFTSTTIDSCSALTTIELVGESTKYSTRSEGTVAGQETQNRKVLCNADGTELIFCPKGMLGAFVLPNTVTKVGSGAFQGCSALTKVTIPGRVTEIGKNAFRSASAIASIEFENSNVGLTIGEKAFYSCTALNQLTLPERLTTLGDYAFGSTSNLFKVTVLSAGDASGVLHFANNAFGKDDSTAKFYVTEVALGAKVPTFDVTGVFGQELEVITVDENNQNYSSVDGILYNKSVTEILFFPHNRDGAFELPDSVVKIGARTFQDRKITSITIGNKVELIDESAFEGCTSLTTVIFAGEGTAKLKIGNNAFYRCNKVTEFNLPTRTQSIGEGAFYACTSLTGIVIPEGVTEIGKYAFGLCYLTSVSLPSTIQKLGMDGSRLMVFCGPDTATSSGVALCQRLEKLTIAANNYFETIDNILYAKTDSGKKDEKGNAIYVASTLLFCPIRKAGATEIVIPSGVTEIAPFAFYSNAVLTSITFNDLEAGAKMTFGDRAFGSCVNLTTITLPHGMDTITAGMFKSCYSLTTIVIPSTVESIENEAFASCSGLTTLTFLNPREGETPVALEIADAKTYNLSPFYGCAKLTGIEFPERTTYLGKFAFGGTYATGGGPSGATSGYESPLISVAFPSTLKRIGEKAFYYATKLTTVTFANGTVLEDNGKSNPAIGVSAFDHCTALHSIALPSAKPEGNDNYTWSIGNSAFNYGDLYEMHIPAVVGAIGNTAFQRNIRLTTFTFENGAKPTFGNDVFNNAAALTNFVIPDGTTAISDRMFYACKSLTTITIPASVTTIGRSAFEDCSTLESVSFATDEGYSKVSKIDTSAFVNTALKSFVFPTREKNAAITLGTSLFQGCKLLETVTLSPSVKKIDGLFTGCYSIVSMGTAGTDFAVDSSGRILCNAKLTSYLYAFRPIEGELTIDDTILEIGTNAFTGQMGLTSVIIPASVQKIGKSAFSGCKALLNVEFKDNSKLTATNLGDEIFASCSILKTVTLPNNMPTIPTKMFYFCYGLENIVIPGTVKKIGSNAFYSAGLKSVTLSEGLEEIASCAFQYTKLESLEIPSTVKYIREGAFMGSSGKGTLTSVTFLTNTKNGGTALLTLDGGSTNGVFKNQPIVSIALPASLTSIGKNAFSGCTELVSCTLPEKSSLTSIMDSAFNNCVSLTSFRIPAAMTSVESSAFNGCSALTDLVFEEGSALLTIKKAAFKGTAITSVSIPKNVTWIYDNAFENCAALTTVTFAEDAALTTIGSSCFKGSGITSIVLPKNVTALGSVSTKGVVTVKDTSSTYQFANCANLESVTFLGDITGIGGYVFQNCTSLTSITIPQTTTVLGQYIFDGCSALTTVTFADLDKRTANLTLGKYAFRNSGLTSITLPKSVSQIPTYCFDGCAALTTFDIQDGVTKLTIENYAFRDSGLTAISIPAAATKIGDYAFSGCEALKTVTFNDNKTMTIGKYAFNNCKSLTAIALPDAVTTLNEYTFAGAGALASVTMNKVKTVGNSVFSGCKALTGITLPESLTTIGANVFLNSGLKSIHIPKDLTSIGNNCFAGCHSLTTYTVDDQNTAFEIYNITDNEEALVEKGSPNLFVALPGKVTGAITLPSGYMLGGYALNGVQGVTEVILPDDLTEIPAYAFFGSTLTTIRLPASVKSIGTGAFMSSKLASIELSENLEKIGSSAFKNSKLSTVTIPDNVYLIENSAFQGCSQLTTVIFGEDSNLTLLGQYVFADSGLTSITLPKKLTTLYGREDDGPNPTASSYTFRGCQNLTSVTFLGDMIAINSYAFADCTALKSITLPETLRYLGQYAFSGSGLESIEIPAGLRSFYENSRGGINGAAYTFMNCTSLKTVILHEGLLCINNSTFKGCEALTTINVPASVTEIGNNAFDSCTSLTTVNFAEGAAPKFGSAVFKNTGLVEIVLPASITKLGSSMFIGCQNLKTVTVLGEVTELPASIFADCAALEKVTLPDSIYNIGDNAFKNAGIKEFTFPAGIEKLGKEAFLGSALTKITIPASITGWNSSPFKGCESLTTVIFEEGCTTVTGSAFSGCTALTSVTLPDTITYVGTSSFEGCTALTDLYVPLSVASLYANVFKGWTENQTIRFACSEADSANFTNNWNTDCEAKILWNQARKPATEKPKDDDAKNETLKP